MKRYLLFVFDQHYPSGGWEDFKGDFSFDGLAISTGKMHLANGRDHFQVVDTESMKVIHEE